MSVWYRIKEVFWGGLFAQTPKGREYRVEALARGFPGKSRDDFWKVVLSRDKERGCRNFCEEEVAIADRIVRSYFKEVIKEEKPNGY